MGKLAIMQPYFFPYLGYWQLMQAVNRFVIYDDVNYIKGGWINRNRFLVNGKVVFLTIPLQQASPFKRICDTHLLTSHDWRDQLLKTIDMAYHKAPYFTEVFPVVEKIIHHDTVSLSSYLAHQLQTLAAFMGIRTEFVTSSRRYNNNALSGQARILDICRREGAQTYINAPGGRALYDVSTFRDAGINLCFITMHTLPYAQHSKAFEPGLSVIDVLMAVGAAGIKQHLDSFELMEAT